MTRALPLLFVLALAGCGSVAPVVAPPVATAAQVKDEVAFERQAVLERLRQQDGRVAAVGYRLATAGLELCQDTGPVAGWTLHDLAQYGPNLRADARAWFGLDDAAPSVSAVVAAGPAARAGILPDDVLLSVNGQALGASAPNKAAGGYDSLARSIGLLDAAMRTGPVRLELRRGAERITATLTPERACAYDAQLVTDEAAGASADGRHVFVTTAMARYAASDDELAVVLGHEYAHDVLQHARRLERAGPARKWAGDWGNRPADLLLSEREADYVGLYLAARAGFAVDGARDFWRRFAADFGASPYVSRTHPGARERAVNLELTAREIADKRARGDKLVPEKPAS